MSGDRSGKQAKPFVVDEAENASINLVRSADESPKTTTIDSSAPTILIEPTPLSSSPSSEADVTSSCSPSNSGSAHTNDSVTVPMAPEGNGSTSNNVNEKIENYLRDLEQALKLWLKCHDNYLHWLWGLRAPLFLLAAIALVPKMVLVWILVVIIKPITLWLYHTSPQSWRNNLHKLCADKFQPSISNTVRNSPFLRDLNEGADQGLPFILFWLYLCCAPVALGWIAVHWIKGFFPTPVNQPVDGEATFVLRQNTKRNSAQSENNFYYSRAFGLVLVAFFALGIPAFFSFSLYENLGIEKMMRSNPVTPITMSNSSGPPKVHVPRVGLAYRLRHSPELLTDNRTHSIKAPTGMDSTYVVGYNGYWPWLRNLGVEPSKASVFFVHFYLVSVASALCMLFFRAWFFFPLNFLSDEHDVQFTANGIKRSSIKGWFLSVLTINRWATGGGPDSLTWKEIKSLRHLEEGFTRLCPLPETAFKKESLSYKLLNKVAAFIDGLSNRMNTGNYLVFSTVENEGDFGRNIKINLNDLNREQRARLFYAVKNWAPHVSIKKTAEEQLLGSTVLQDVRYTQLWFDLLTSKTRVKRQSVLNSGETLKDAEYTVVERLSSGGQATAYLARKSSGELCVLKEFILATSSSSGALIESAREFETEVSLLSQLNNPGIVHLEDFFTDEGRVYVVLEYVQGQSLRQKVQQEGPLSEAQVVLLTKSICDVLEYLHGFNPPIVHRDITPENIIMLPDDTIKLIDFSLAVKNDGRSTTDSCGKQAFTPPEQFREEVCVQSDIYALGATMYYLLTGVVPKPITSSSPRTKAPHVSPELNAIVERATQLDLNQRYESVHWLKLDLANINAKGTEPALS
jgi:hypothetical protein